MPFKSQAQRGYMYATNPAMAKRWSKETPNEGKLPNKVAARKKALMKKVGSK